MSELGYKDVIVPQSLIFDRIFPTLEIAQNNALFGDGVAEGRFILIDSQNPNAYVHLQSESAWPKGDIAIERFLNARVFAATDSINTLSYSPNTHIILKTKTDDDIGFQFYAQLYVNSTATTPLLNTKVRYQWEKNGGTAWRYVDLEHDRQTDPSTDHDGEIYQKIHNQYIYIGKIATTSYIDNQIAQQVAVHELQLADSGGLINGVNGLSVNLASWLTTDTSGRITLAHFGANEDSMMFINGNYLDLHIDTNTLKREADSNNLKCLKVKLKSNGGLLSASSGIYIDTNTIATKNYVDTQISSSGSGSSITYTAGSGINITNNTIALKDLYARFSPFYCDGSGCLQLSYDTNTLKTYMEDQGGGDKYYLTVKIDSANGGLTSSANGITISTDWLNSRYVQTSGGQLAAGMIPLYDGGHLAIVGNGLSLDADARNAINNISGYTAAYPLTLTNKEFGLKFSTSGGLGLGPDNQTLQVLLDYGLAVSNDGIRVNCGKSITTSSTDTHPLEVRVKTNGGLYIDSGNETPGLAVKCVNGGGISCGADGIYLTGGSSGSGTTYSAGTGIAIDAGVISVNIITSGGLSIEDSALAVNTGAGLIKNVSGAISIKTKTNSGIKLDTNGLSVCDIYRQSTTTSTIVGFTGHTAESYIRKTDNIITGFNELYGQGYITGNGLATDTVTVIMRCDGSSTALDATQTLTNVIKVGMVRTYHRVNTDVLDDLGLVSVPLLKGTLDDIPVLSFTATLASCGCGFIMEGYY